MVVRPATSGDAEAVAILAAEFHAYLKGLGDPTRFHFTAETFLRDGFGTQPAFAGLVAEAHGEVVGYALLTFGYDTDRSRREAYLNDLFVTETQRGRGVGRLLMRAAAEAARTQHGAQGLWWGVYERNTSACRFYEHLGATYLEGVRFMAASVDTLLLRPPV